MNTIINSSEQIIEQINIILQSKRQATINIINDRLTLSVFFHIEKNIKKMN